MVAPASTLHNWQQELTRFVPNLKALPYWGNVKDRATLRKFWSKKEISYNQEAPFHVLITSYQLVFEDLPFPFIIHILFLIGDPRSTILSARQMAIHDIGRSSKHQEFLKRKMENSFGLPMPKQTIIDRHAYSKFYARYACQLCNKHFGLCLLLELWALLHFIMPSLFDSHDEFNEWFSKDIENAAENKGSKLNEHQLRRLHMILKPFMLRRVKRHVQNELSEKVAYYSSFRSCYFILIPFSD